MFHSIKQIKRASKQLNNGHKKSVLPSWGTGGGYSRAEEGHVGGEVVGGVGGDEKFDGGEVRGLLQNRLIDGAEHLVARVAHDGASLDAKRAVRGSLGLR